MEKTNFDYRLSGKEMGIALFNAVIISLLLSSELFVGMVGISWALSVNAMLTNALYLISALVTGIVFVWLGRYAYKVELGMLEEKRPEAP